MATSSAAGRKRAGTPRPEPAARVLRRFRTVFSAVRSHFRTIEKKVGVSGAQVWALSQVAAHPGLGVNQLARAMDIHQSTASNLLRGLLEQGLVVSERGGGDRRAVQLNATARGMRLLAKAPAPLTGLLPEALGRLDPTTLLRLDRDLEKLIDELKAHPRMAKSLITPED